MKAQSFKHIAYFFISCCLTFLYHSSFAQGKDSTGNETGKKNNNIFQFAIKSITKSSDTSKQADVLNVKSEEPFLPYEGKGIRHIIIREFGFEKIFSDTARETYNSGTKLLNRLHRNTRVWVINDNLFIKEKTPLNAYLVADNERYLRTLEFIHDVRILVKPVSGQPDSVDLVVITKDLFSLTAELYDLNSNRFKGRVFDANILGTAQKFAVTALLDKNRTPSFGYDLYYSKKNIAHTFVSGILRYSTINPDLRDGAEDEHAWYLGLEMPLVSQSSHLAGALQFGHNQSFNYFKKPDSSFYYYSYSRYDAWIGYNLGVEKFLNNSKLKGRHFIGIRYFNNKFSQIPVQVDDQYNFTFNNRQAVLAQITFFRQRFFKTNYIFAFGTTEDVPYGYNIAATAGWHKQMDLNRLYAGIEANRYAITEREDILQYFLRAGTFFNKGEWQDAGLLTGASIFSRLFLYGNVKIRQYLSFTYTRQFNRIALDPLNLNNPFGIQYFGADSTTGKQRISLHTETSFFLKYRLFGFRFAPFAFADLSVLTPEQESFSESGWYYGLGGGVRTRNNNLVFNTIELRFIYFPRKAEQSNSFKVNIRFNLLFRYNSNYVKAPDIIQLNSDRDNSISVY